MHKQTQFVLFGLIGLFLLLLTFGLGFYSYPLITPASSHLTMSGQAASPDSQAGSSSTMPSNEPTDEPSDTILILEESAEPTMALSDVDLTGVPVEELALFADAWRALNRDFFGEKPTAREQIYGSIRGLLGVYDDPYTFFIVPETNEVEAGNLRGSFGGIGAEIRPSDEGYRLTPQRDSPAEGAGIQKDDILIQVDETKVTQETTTDEVIALIRGDLGSEVQIGLLRLPAAEQPTEESTVEASLDGSTLLTETAIAAGELLTVTVIRAEIQTPSMDWRLISTDNIPVERLAEAAIDAEEVSKIGYIQHRIYSDRSPIEMERAIKELLAAGAERFIIDLRGNPGGPVNAVIEISDMWIDDGTIMIEHRANGTEKRFEAVSGSLVGNEPVVIILDGGSASASEIFAGALHDHQRAVLLGEKSYGKGSVQIIHGLPDSSSMHITNANWYTPDGHRIHGEGLLPDVPIEPGKDFLHEAILYILAK